MAPATVEQKLSLAILYGVPSQDQRSRVREAFFSKAFKEGTSEERRIILEECAVFTEKSLEWWMDETGFRL
jgi:hypothetical protein